MASSAQPEGPIHYSQAINNVIVAGQKIIDDWPVSGQQHNLYSLNRLAAAVDDLHQRTRSLEAPLSAPDDLFSAAAVEMQAGYVLIAAGNGAATGDKSATNAALDNLRVGEAERSGPVNPLRFDKELLQSPPESASDQAALDDFKSRATRTLDQMVKEADEVLSGAVKQFEGKFEQFWKELMSLAGSFSASEGSGVSQAGIETVISSLKRIAGLLQNDHLKRAVDYLKEMVDQLKLQEKMQQILAGIFGCSGTKEDLDKLKVNTRVNRVTLKAAGARMAELSRQYVLVLKQVRRVLSIVGAVGGFLLLTAAAHYAGLGLPVAYALIALATLLIGVTFAEGRMRDIISSL